MKNVLECESSYDFNVRTSIHRYTRMSDKVSNMLLHEQVTTVTSLEIPHSCLSTTAWSRIGIHYIINSRPTKAYEKLREYYRVCFAGFSHSIHFQKPAVTPIGTRLSVQKQRSIIIIIIIIIMAVGAANLCLWVTAWRRGRPYCRSAETGVRAR